MLGEPTSLSWDDFVSLCGQRTQLGNPLEGGENFRAHFVMRTIQWEGLIKQVRGGLFSLSPSFLLIAMNPTLSTGGLRKGESPILENGRGPEGQKGMSDLELLQREEEGMKGDGADLALAFDGDISLEIAKLTPGDKITFEATLHKLGKR